MNVRNLIIAFALLATPNRYLMSYKKEELPQYKFAEKIKQSGIENPTLLNYGFLDGGFYTASGILPIFLHAEYSAHGDEPRTARGGADGQSRFCCYKG